MRINIGGERVEVPDDFARALLAALRGERLVEPPQASAFEDLTALVARISHVSQHLGVVKELAMSRADATGGYSNRRALGIAAAMAPSQLGRVLEGHGLPRDRRSGGVDLAIAFRTVDDGKLHLAGEADVAGLPSFTLPFAPAERAMGPTQFAGRELTFYYRPQVPIAVADLGRTAGYTLRSTEQGLIACVTEQVFDALFGDPRIDPTRPTGR
ncbi:hypothetical protein G3I60_40980 [Streptomyces sp. SID13666]|uniref:hypothetical protein n=1 Tax=unclassified Streptomyces TaxID=2593676 RepID=UPI0013BFC4B5|nr:MULTISPECIES: hypothetical protein [unclassified Streptomyces]NEA60374.1 hypothetical protein [Streptomyces sp. SID13666]NEA76764.1 hypothetical protein [Streptomyces sp. SID13588]